MQGSGRDGGGGGGGGGGGQEKNWIWKRCHKPNDSCSTLTRYNMLYFWTQVLGSQLAATFHQIQSQDSYFFVLENFWGEGGYAPPT